MFPDVGLITPQGGNYTDVVVFVAEGRQLMATQTKSVTRRVVTAVGIAGGAAAIATGMALAGAGTAAAENQHNVVTQDGNKFTPKSAAVTSAQSSVGAAPAVQSSDPGTDFLVNLGTALSNAEVRLGTVGTNAISQAGTALGDAQVRLGTVGTNVISQAGTALGDAQVRLGTVGTNVISQAGTALGDAQVRLGTAGTNAISQAGTALGDAQVRLGTAGNNALTQVGNAGFGVLNGIGNLFNRG
jgi:hypothetical protein